MDTRGSEKKNRIQYNQQSQNQKNDNKTNLSQKKNSSSKCIRRQYSKFNQNKQSYKNASTTDYTPKKPIRQDLLDLANQACTYKDSKFAYFEQEKKPVMLRFNHIPHHKRKNMYQQAVYKLNQDFFPEVVPCRDEEKKYIQDFIQQGLKLAGQSETLYISGVPGIGKTLCLNQVIRKMNKKKQITDNMKYIYVNALRLKKPQRVFKLIWQRISGITRSDQDSLYYLNQYFQIGKITLDSNKTIDVPINIIAIDQFDYLSSGEQQVIYNIIQWTQCQKSKLVLIAISNTIDFPEQLPTKITSRMGNKRLLFKPYSDSNISIILNQRIADKPVFQDKAIQYISKKIAKSSSDIRKCLNILRASIISYLKQCNKNKEQLSKVTRAILEKIYAQSTDDIFVKNYQHLHFIHQCIFRALADFFKYNSASTCRCTYTELFVRTRNYMITEYKYSLKQALIQLRDMGYIDYKYSQFISDRRIEKTIKLKKGIKQEHIQLKVTVQTILRAIQQLQQSQEEQNQ